MSKKKYWRLVVNYEDAQLNEEDWIEDSWLSCTPEKVIDDFNSFIYPGQRRRELIAAIPLKDNLKKTHSWEKSNLVTQIKGGSIYDSYKCEKCGITGKRFGFCGSVILDSKYKADKYKFCNPKQKEEI